MVAPKARDVIHTAAQHRVHQLALEIRHQAIDAARAAERKGPPDRPADGNRVRAQCRLHIPAVEQFGAGPYGS